MLKWTKDMLERAPLKATLDDARKFALEHLPVPLADRFLQEDPVRVCEHVRASLERGHQPRYEMIPMPRGSTGDRPILYVDMVTRIAYASLVAVAEEYLDPPSRSFTRRHEFTEHGTTASSGSHVVIGDVAACYEYVVPEVLTEELFLRSDKFDLVQHLATLLRSLSTFGRGLPQMLDASDRLADMYLAKVDRALDRQGLNWRRTADDYKIVVSRWEDANPALETLERELRAVGLILSADKTRIVKAGEDAVTRSSGEPDDNDNDDDDDDDDSDEEDSDESGGSNDSSTEAEMPPQDRLFWWHSAWLQRRQIGGPKLDPLPASVITAIRDPGQLTANILVDLAFANPPHLEYLIGLLLDFARKSDATDRLIVETMNGLLRNGRKNAWSVLWLLWGIGQFLGIKRLKSQISAEPLAKQALADPRESVRVEAAWYLAKHHSVSAEQVRQLHLGASGLTMTGVAAVATLAAERASPSDKNKMMQLLNGIKGGEPMNDLAAAWAKRSG